MVPVKETLFATRQMHDHREEVEDGTENGAHSIIKANHGNHIFIRKRDIVVQIHRSSSLHFSFHHHCGYRILVSHSSTNEEEIEPTLR